MSTNLDNSRIVKIEDVKQGDFLKLTTLGGTVYGTKVYIKHYYNKEDNTYTVSNKNDSSDRKHIKKGRLVLVDFNY